MYIISPVEKDVFLKLQTDREREHFIEAFWKHRDPTPATPENEFKTEHYRRIGYANHFLGRESPSSRLADRPRADLYHPGRTERHQPHYGQTGALR